MCVSARAMPVSKIYRVPKYTSAVFFLFGGLVSKSCAHTTVRSFVRFFGGEGQPNVDVECDYLKIQRCARHGDKRRSERTMMTVNGQIELNFINVWMGRCVLDWTVQNCWSLALRICTGFSPRLLQQ